MTQEQPVVEEQKEVDPEKYKVSEEVNETDPGEVAARMYGMFLPRFDYGLQKLSKKGLYRVLNALIKLPLVDVHYKMSKDEQEVLAIAQKLFDAKTIMITQVLSEKIEQEQQKETVAEEAKPMENETNGEIKEN